MVRNIPWPVALRQGRVIETEADMLPDGLPKVPLYLTLPNIT
jgi:hypothetical protein